MTDDRFFVLLPLFRSEIERFRFRYQRTDGVESAAREIYRKTVTGESKGRYTFEEALRFDSIEADIRRVRHPRRAGAVDSRPWNAAQDSCLEPIAQAADSRGFGVHFRCGQPCGDPEPDNRRNIFGTGATVPLVLSAGQDRLQTGPALDPENARALRTVELVCRKRQQVHAQCADVHRDLA